MSKIKKSDAKERFPELFEKYKDINEQGGEYYYRLRKAKASPYYVETDKLRKHKHKGCKGAIFLFVDKSFFYEVAFEDVISLADGAESRETDGKRSIIICTKNDVIKNDTIKTPISISKKYLPFEYDNSTDLIKDIEDIKKNDQDEKGIHRDTERKKRLVDARQGQGKYRDELLGLWSNQCAITGISEKSPALRIGYRLCATSVSRLRLHFRLSGKTERAATFPHTPKPMRKTATIPPTTQR